MAPSLARLWQRMQPHWLPFADAATEAVPMSRWLRLSLFQISAAVTTVMVFGVLNRVMIVELGVSAALVAGMVSLPLLLAPFRAFIGFRSDIHRSFLGWRRVPYLWLGALLQFGGFAIMPFALLLLAAGEGSPHLWGMAGAALAFLMVGAGLHTAQTAGLALAMDLATEETRPRVVALLYCVLLAGMVGVALLGGWLLEEFSSLRLVRVVQGAALLTLLLNAGALWKQEARDPRRTAPHLTRPAFRAAWQDFIGQRGTRRFLAAVALGTAGFSMQDILLEPYGGEVLAMPVTATTTLTAVMALGALSAFILAGRRLTRGADPCRLAGAGVVVGIAAMAAVLLSKPFGSLVLFRLSTFGLGLGAGLFAVGTLTIATTLQQVGGYTGLALGAWGATQATAAGLGVAAGGALRDAVWRLADHGGLGSVLGDPVTGYAVVFQCEIALLFLTLVVIGPLVNLAPVERRTGGRTAFGLADLPG